MPDRRVASARQLARLCSAERARAAASTAALIAIWVLLLLGLFGMIYQYLGWRYAFNSDDLYGDALCEDILHGRDLSGQHFPGAPYLFPDVLLLLSCHALSGNLVVIYSLYCYLFFLLMLAALTAIIRELGLPWKSAAFTAASGLLFLIAAHLHNAYENRAVLLVHSGNHFGASLVGLVLLAMVLRCLRIGLGWASVTSVVLLCSLGTFSDKLLVLQYILPAALALGVLAFRRLVAVGRCAGMLAALGGGTLLSPMLNAAARARNFHLLSVETTFTKPHFSDVASVFQLLLKSMEQQDVLRCAFEAHLVLAGAVLLVYLWKSPRFHGDGASRGGAAGGGLLRRGDAVLFLASAVLLSLACNLGAVFCTGMAEQGLDRYSLPRVLFSFVCLGVFLDALPWRGARRASRWLDVAIMVFAVCRLVPLVSALDRGRFQVPYPPLARAVDELVRQRGPMRGLAGFWTARYLSFITHDRIVVRPLSPVGTPWFHADNPNLYLSLDKQDVVVPRYAFIVVAPVRDVKMQPKLIERVYGKPAEKIPVGGDVIWLYPDGIENPWFTRFLHTQLAPRLRKQRRFIAPMAPADLAVPKANLSRPAARSNVWLAPGQTLEVRFARPVSGQVIDLSAHYTDQFLLGFYLDDKLVGTAAVPPTPWTGWVYEADPGMQSRLLPLPSSFRGRSWNRLVVHPVYVTAGACLGHFLVYEESVPGLHEPRDNRLNR